MLGIVALAAVFASAVLITVADALIKKIAVTGSFWAAVVDPIMLPICVLYFVQILIGIYIFRTGDLAVYANLFIVFYSVLMIAFGVFFFHEHLSGLQMLGIALALVGALLLNS